MITAKKLSKKLGDIVRSAPPATASLSAEFPDTPSAGAASEKTSESMPGCTARPPFIDREVPLQVLIPEHIRKKLGIKAAEEGRSLRALVLIAIRSLGIEVTEADIKGKRGQKRA